jgi:4-hydroxyphenylpyruvate dioxygenase
LRIPAIRGIGGSVICFIDGGDLDSVWDVEFEALPADDAREAGLPRIDHVAQTMNYEEMLSWVLFYTSIFRARKSPMVDVVDPGGLVRSQVIESEDAALRLTLNGAENRKTLAGRFMAESFGSSDQHLAMASDDIFATAERLEALRFTGLDISASDRGGRWSTPSQDLLSVSARRNRTCSVNRCWWDRSDGNRA